MQPATTFVKQTIKKIHLRTGHESPEGVKRNSSILSFTLALDGVGVHSQTLAALTHGPSN